MEETVIWVTGLIAEILLAVTVIFGVLLWRSRRTQRQLLAQLADHEKISAERAATAQTSIEISETPETENEPVPAEASTVETPTAETPPTDEAKPPKPTNTSTTNEFDQLLTSIDEAKLDESVERLQQRLETATRSLQRLVSENPGQGHAELESLQLNLLEMSQEVDSLQQSNAQLQQDLRRQTQAMENTAAERQHQKEMVLQHAKKLRGDIVLLRDKLKNSEVDVQRLESEKAALAAEYAALNKEYERIYSNMAK